jgi:hypothetical protein
MCDIQGIQLAGQNFGSQGVPSQLEVSAHVDCPAVHIEVRRNPGDPTPILSATNIAATPASQPLAGIPPNLVVHQFALTGGLSVRCGEILHVSLICANDASCRRSEALLVQCKGVADSECPTTVILSVAPPVDQSADCIAAGDHVVTVVDPVGTDITYFWSAGPVGSVQTSLPGTGPTQTIQVQAGDPQSIVSVIAIKAGCPPAPPGTMLFPAGDAVQCPTGFAVVVAQSTATIAGPHTNTQGIDWNVPAVPPGAYTIRITQPTGSGEAYEWFNNDGTLAATGSANSHNVAVNAGQSATTSFRIKPSECCPAMMGSVTLTGTAATTIPPGGTSPGDTPPGETPPAEERPPVEPPPSFDLCALLRLIVGIGLIGTLLSVVATACNILVVVTLPVMVSIAFGAIVIAILLLLTCNPTFCRVVGVLVWAFKWAIVLGALLAIGCGSILSAFIVAIYGGIVAALIWLLVANGCRVPSMRGLP